MNVYFSDIFNVAPEDLEKYGAFNVSLINDLPLFIDPFLLFNSEKKEYQDLHKEILRYISFLSEQSSNQSINEGLLRSWYCFPEVKQTWLGYSESGNSGRGPGIEFARALDKNLSGVFANFNQSKISKSPHIEKLCLIKPNIGRDNVSDFVTNLIKGFLLEYTQKFTKNHIDKTLVKNYSVGHVSFNYKTSTWISKTYMLPSHDDDFVLLSPKDLLTKDDNWINQSDLIHQFYDIVSSVSNSELRSQLNFYFSQNLPKPEYTKKGKEKAPKKKDIHKAVIEVIEKYPQLLDYYIRYKEEHGDQATSISQSKVEEVHNLFVLELSKFIDQLSKETKFYENTGDTLEESYQRVMYLKDLIENKDCYRIFYQKGKVIGREADLQIMYRLTWYATPSDITREANEGRGPADCKISRGSNDKTLVEFKLASNKKLEQNLKNQVEIYKKAHDTGKSIKAILFFTDKEEEKVVNMLEALGLSDEKYVVLIDARPKISASNVK